MIYLSETLTHNRSTRFCNINLMCPRFKRSTEGGGWRGLEMTEQYNQLCHTAKTTEKLHSFPLVYTALTQVLDCTDGKHHKSYTGQRNRHLCRVNGRITWM